MKFALNHMTAPRLDWRSFIELSKSLDCIGLEFRNDLDTPLWAGAAPQDVRSAMADAGLRMVGLSQVYPFNSYTDAIRDEVIALIANAKAAGAETISLIPRNDGSGRGNGERQANLRLALREILPLLQDAQMKALVEPLGFERSSLRHKKETIDAIEAVGGKDHYKIVHDTFHHTLASETEIFPDHTGIIHISGVTEPDLALNEMEDAHRVLVTAEDRLGNIEQIAALLSAGYAGPISMEAFSPLTHALDHAQIKDALAASFDFIRSQVSAPAA